MKRFAVLPLVLFLFACGDTPTEAPTADMMLAADPGNGAFTETTSYTEPFFFSFFVPCAADGAGEDVELSGELHWLFHTTVTPNGQFKAKFHAQPQNVSGFGLTTGDMYHATGVTQDHFSGSVGETYTFVNNFRIIGQGPGNNFTVHENFHYTVNANGEVTTERTNFRIDCK